MNYKDKRKQEMYDWFHERFIVPEAFNPGKGPEARYQYSCDGPYCPKEVLPSNFKGVFPDELISAVVRDLELERMEWYMRKTEASVGF